MGGDLGIALAGQGQEDDGGPLPELGRRRGGVLNGTEDVVLTFGDVSNSRPAVFALKTRLF